MDAPSPAEAESECLFVVSSQQKSHAQIDYFRLRHSGEPKREKSHKIYVAEAAKKLRGERDALKFMPVPALIDNNHRGNVLSRSD